MTFMFFLFFSVLNYKIDCKSGCKKHNSYDQNKESFHHCTPLSFGVVKYAAIASTANNASNPKLKYKVNLPDKKLLIIPAVNTYLAASANILATTLLLSLFTMNYTTKRR